MAEFLDSRVRAAQSVIEQRFFFRKLGLPFDYASQPGDFPSRFFANAREARQAVPNSQGFGAGFAMSCLNHSLLFDGYLLRLELGFGTESDEQILDRLIGGLIRLTTVTPRSFLVRGLTADGRGFYGTTAWECHAAWAFSVSRGVATAAIVMESQEKFKSIAKKWIERLERDKFQLTTVDGKVPSAVADTSPGSFFGVIPPALLAAASRAAEDGGRWLEKCREMLAESEGSRLRQPANCPDGSNPWLWRQVALSVLAENCPDPEIKPAIDSMRRQAALAVVPRLAKWREWRNESLEKQIDLDWRKFPEAELAGQPSEFSPGFKLPESWAVLESEATTVRVSLEAMLTILLAGDKELAEAHAPEMVDCLNSVAWEAMRSMSSLAPLPAIHARGMELGLWDAELAASQRMSPAEEISFAAKYLEPDYDAKNPAQAGHSAPPPGKRREEDHNNGKGGKRRRRRRR